MFVITGGGSGVGQALALSLANRGHLVVITGRRVAALQQTAALNDRISYVQSDVSDDQGRADLVRYLSRFETLSGIVHNAGIIDPITPISNITLAEWRHTMATNVEAPLFLTQSLLPKLTRGRVLHIGSGAAYFPVQGWTAYCTSKAALSMVTQCWQTECTTPAFASVTPGIIDTPMQAEIRQADAMDPDKVAFFQNLKSENRLVSSETVASFLTWLLLDTDQQTYASKEWDIYDTEHHALWLKPPHQVPSFEDE